MSGVLQNNSYIPGAKMEKDIISVLEDVKNRTGYDFLGYKENTIKRRISRRLHETKCADYSAYMEYIKNDNSECIQLINEMIIKVTEFFRNKECYKMIENKVLPKIMDSKLISHKSAIDNPIIRVWSAGCSTGEETYSLAILLNEICQRQAVNIDLKIYGTDICKESLKKAKSARYPKSSTKKIGKNILNKYFTEENTGDDSSVFVIKDNIKKMVKFSSHCLVSGLKLAGFDFIVCRNVLIYFNRSLQEKVFENFYNGLKSGGFLWLGEAESLVGLTEKEYQCIDKKAKIYMKKYK